MRSKLDNVTITSFASLLTIPAGKVSPSRACLVNQAAKPWICQQCYFSYGYRISLRLKMARLTSQLDRNQGLSTAKLRTPRSWFSTSPRCLANKGTIQTPRKDLPSEEEGRRSQTSKKFSHVMDHLQSNIFIAGQRLNDLTGYSGIEALKKDIEEQGHLHHPLALLLH